MNSFESISRIKSSTASLNPFTHVFSLMLLIGKGKEKAKMPKRSLLLQSLILRYAMSDESENHKKLVRRLYEDVYNQGKLEAIPEIYAANFVTHPSSVSPEGLHGLLELETFVKTLRAGLQDLHFTILDEICVGDKIVTRWRMDGTMTGHLFNFAPTNKRGSTTGITIHRIANGKIIETWEEADMLNALNQFVGPSES
ncbi:MAG: hypothetical protein C5B54_11525 [Acidobacteria bacterium]|nr:MAG: hypothetical protein C5B54_11525 [Acidobacteriota bacterium]